MKKVIVITGACRGIGATNIAGSFIDLAGGR